MNISNVDPQMLKKQYFTLLDVRNQEQGLRGLNSEAVDDFEGLLNFLESIFEQNPDQFPVSDHIIFSTREAK